MKANNFLFILLFFLTCCIGGDSLAKESLSQLSFHPLGEDVALSYTVTDSEEGFFSAIQDILKAGKTVRVRHEIEMETVGFWSKKLTDIRVDKYLSYDALDGIYRYGNTSYMTKSTKSKVDIRRFVLGVDQIVLLPKSHLKRGDEYEVSMRVRYSEMDKSKGILKYFGQGWFKETLDVGIVYVAR